MTWTNTDAARAISEAWFIYMDGVIYHRSSKDEIDDKAVRDMVQAKAAAGDEFYIRAIAESVRRRLTT